MLQIGQLLTGQKATCTIFEELHPSIWRAAYLPPTQGAKTVILKSASESRLYREHGLLQRFRNVPSIRQIIDEIQTPPLLVLENLDRNVLEESGSKRLKVSDIKFVARGILEALAVVHEERFVHAGTSHLTILLYYR